MLKLVTDDSQPANVRVEALFALEALKAGELEAATTAALASKVDAVRAAGRVAAAKADPTKAVTELPKLLDDASASIIEKQMALGVLGGMPESKPTDETLAVWLDKMIAGTVPPDLLLDVQEAAETRANARKLKLHAPLREKLKQYDQKVRADAAGDMSKRYPDALAGGDAAKGRDLFVNSAAVYCQRCHKLDGQGGEVGPLMNGIGKQKTAMYLLESIVNPNAQIAQGYQSVILSLADGKTVSGVLRAKDAKGYTIITPENKVLTFAADDVEGSKPDRSAMPDDLYKKLSRRELRDVVAFLASLTEPEKK
jgi:quinoprotein glucose dehydrogenase